MKAGLLVCDHVNVAYQAKFGDYTDMFVQLFPDFDWQFYDVTESEFPEDVDECEVYFATGSRHSVYEDIPWIEQLKTFVQQLYQHQKYFIGFCFGHQLLGAALGGQVAKSPQGWCVGVHHFSIKNTQNWMLPPSKAINLLMMCQDQILVLPPHTTLLAGSSSCPHAMIQVGATMLGIQAHPEFTKAYDHLLMETRVDRIGKEVVDAGIESLSLPLSTFLIQKWVLSFLS